LKSEIVGEIMAITLSDRHRRQLAAGTVIFGCIYILAAGKEFLASVFAADTNPASLSRGVRLSPGNADYRHRLGRYFEFAGGDPTDATENLQAAVVLNPYNARYWFDLASEYQITGDVSRRRAALDRALAAEPTAPDVAWEAANFFLVDGDTDRALREFSVVMANEASLADAAMRASWRVRPDVDVLLRDVVPAKTDSLLTFSSLLASKKETEGVIKTWDRLTQLHEKFQNRYLYEYVHYLIEMHRPEAAMAAWERSADTLGLSAYLPTEDNLVVNGDFSLDILNGGFDWTYVTRTGVKPLLDSTDFRQGHRSLSLTFEGPGINDAGIQQLVPVRGDVTYDFSAYYKSADFEGAGGPQIVLRDAYTGVPLFSSETLTDSDFWKEVHSRVATPKSTTLLSLAIERFPAGSPIRGKLWLGDFELSPVDPSTESPDAGSPNSDSAKHSSKSTSDATASDSSAHRKENQ
jgi:tetratricopeptide (TPR) repeat protein